MVNISKNDGVILSKNCISPIDSNVLVVGSVGRGKSRNVIEPNILQMSSSYVINDVNGFYYEKYGNLLKENGYKIKVLDFCNFNDTISNLYNPFKYLTDDDSIESLVDCLFAWQNAGQKKHEDTFLEICEQLLFSACIHYLIEFCTEENKINFAGLRGLISSLAEYENDTDEKSIGEKLFETLPTDSITYIIYEKFRKSVGKCFKGRTISAIIRLNVFTIPKVASLTNTDNVELDKLGDEKTALFIITAPSSNTYSFLSAILYSQIFETLKNTVMTRKKQLAVPVKCMMDEFANVCFIPDLAVKLMIMKKYNISCVIVVQSLEQLMTVYDNGQEIADCCKTHIFLGSNESKTLEYFTDKVKQSQTNTKSGFIFKIKFKRNKVLNKLSSLSSDECIVFMPDQKPIKDKKYNLEHHPNYKKVNDCIY